MIDVDVVREHGADGEVVRVIVGKVTMFVIVNDRPGEVDSKGIMDPDNFVVLTQLAILHLLQYRDTEALK